MQDSRFISLAYICLLALVGLGSCVELQMPSREDIEGSINRTIEEVEKLMEQNPTLPRLSRSEIVNILFNITSKDVGSLENEALEAIRKTREDYQRALMVVLPYKPSDDGESLTELYTKPPMVQIVPDNVTESRQNLATEVAHSIHHQASNYSQSVRVDENTHKLLTAHMRFDDPQNSKFQDQMKVKNVEKTSIITSTISTTTTTTTARPTSHIQKIDNAPQKFVFNLNVKDQRVETSHTSIATKRPVYKGTFSRYRTSYKPPPKKLEIIYSSTTINTPTKMTEVFKTESTTTKVKPPISILSSDQWHYNAPPLTTTLKTILELDDSPWKPMAPSKGFFLPTIESQSDDSHVSNFADVKVEDFEKVMETHDTEKPLTIFVTPSTMTNQKKTNHFENFPSGFKLTTTTTTTTAPSSTMRQEVEQLLKSIGLQPIKMTKQTNIIKSHQSNVEAQTNENIIDSIKDSNLEKAPSDSLKLDKNNSFQAAQSNVKNLSPDIQLLFQKFGLQMPDRVNTPISTTTLKPIPVVNVNSYTNFKPLPTSSVKDDDFRSFLARFGLGAGENRNKKAMESRQITKRPSLLDVIPNNMRKVLENIGLIKKSPRVVKDTTIESKMEMDASKIVAHTTPLNEHISKPHEGVVLVDDSSQKEKIKNLLTTVRMVQEGKADVQDVQKVARELLQSTKTLAEGPDLLKLEEILNSYKNSLKNEVKRQQDQTTTTSAPIVKESNEPTLPSINNTGIKKFMINLLESLTPNDESDESKKTDQSSSSSTTDEKAANPSILTSLDISDVVNKTSNSTSSTSDTPSGTESTTKSNSFFDNFNLDDYTTTEDSAKNSNVNLSDLEDSFGGSTSEPDPVLPTRPKTGFYFLVDWNSFLEVGEDGKDKVSLRFAPKVGDRTRFIPVKIP
ncbi:cell wall protein DAN4 [Copidosoma floridanum]|uniref:cell wall protein DAN4 n=1 Tax=Copidosoma floridanum TaxID=29053 RepID=UPI0006C955E8|nr:cell wall protein DAN4 [Copidosoma floridanum]